MDGLCPRCARVRRVVSGRGGVFWLCTWAERDPGFAKYPRQPVVSCAAFRAADAQPEPPPDGS